MTGPYAQEEFLDDLYRVTAGQTDEELAKLTVARSTELIGWMNEQGVRFQPPLGGTLSLEDAPGGGLDVIARLPLDPLTAADGDGEDAREMRQAIADTGTTR